MLLGYIIIFGKTVISVVSQRKLPGIVSNAPDLMVGIVMCRRIPGSPAFIVNVEKLGVSYNLIR